MLSAALEHGAWALGLIFHKPSPRRCKQSVAGAIARAHHRDAEICGVFVNPKLDELTRVADATGLTMLQLHGDEGPAFCAEAGRRTGCKVIKAVQVATRADVAHLEPFRTDFHLLDTRTGEGLRGGTGVTFDWELAHAHAGTIPVILSGGLTPENVAEGIESVRPHAVDVASGTESSPGAQGPGPPGCLLRGRGVGGARAARARSRGADMSDHKVQHRFGDYGGQYVPETLMPALAELEEAWLAARLDPVYTSSLVLLLNRYAGRPTPLYRAKRLSEVVGHSVLLKREDLMHTGSHKLNNALGQALLAKRMGKDRIIAETGAGQHGVASATACALLDLECIVYMGSEDIRRQEPNVKRMELLGATVVPVEAGARTLKEAVSEAIRDWVTNVATTHYIIGSAVGPAPYPAMVRDLQRVIGDEARMQVLELEGVLPDRVIACVGGGSNAIGIFVPFVDDADVELIGVEAAGEGLESGRHGAPLTTAGRAGVLHGSLSAVMQDEEGQISEAHSVSAGLDYPGSGPEHAHLRDSGRALYEAVTDEQAIAAFHQLAELEGIIPALESSHAVAWVMQAEPSDLDLICLSGRGDKDLEEVLARGALDGQ